MSSKSKKGNPDINSLFLSNAPVNEPPLVSPTGPLWRELPIYRAFFIYTIKFIIKIFLNKEMFPFSQKP
jgi:hypothetical protein